ncbi:MAG: hypothetical protein LBU58_02500 [Clostridiales bacterium]|jgi:hypothetical protein|nr:hypothetical protein [Clostridiales bacterium]
MNKKSGRVSAALFLVLALLFTLLCTFAACDGGGDGDNSGDGGENADGTGSDGNAGDTGSGLVGGDDGETSEGPDDAFATTTQAAYPAEVQAQLTRFQDAASSLQMDDVASAAALLRTFRELVFPDAENDALFFAYEENMQYVSEGLNSNYEEEPPNDQTINDAVENGFLYVSEDESSYFMLRADFLADTFSEFVSQKVQALLTLRSKHYKFHTDHDFTENSTLMVTLDQLAEMIVDWENYAKTYPDATNLDEIENNLDYYLKIYIGSIQIENSGLYRLAGEDENGEALFQLMDEPKQSYLKFIENYPDSACTPIISELYEIYRKNNFLYTVEIEDFFRARGLAYDL